MGTGFEGFPGEPEGQAPEPVFGEEGLGAPDGGDVFGNAGPVDDGLDDEEREQLRQVAEEQEERKRAIAERASTELREKEERRSAGQRALNDWYGTRDSQIEARKKANKEEEWAFLKMREEHKSKNPWIKIIDNCEMNKSKYAGNADVSRMR